MIDINTADHEGWKLSVKYLQLCLASASLLLLFGCARAHSPLAGSWIAHTSTPASGTMQITLQFDDNGHETASSVMQGSDPAKPIVAHGAYAVTGTQLVQTLDDHYVGAETLTLDGPYNPHPTSPRIIQITSQWSIAGNHLTLTQPLSGQSCVLVKQ